MRLVGVTAINTARADNTDWRLLGFHGPNLYTRGMGTQQMSRIKIERVVHGTGRVMAWNIQRFKVVIIIFNFWASSHSKASFGKELANTLLHLSYRVNGANGLTTAW